MYIHEAVCSHASLIWFFTNFPRNFSELVVSALEYDSKMILLSCNLEVQKSVPVNVTVVFEYL